MTMTVISPTPASAAHGPVLVARDLGRQYFGLDAVRGFSIDLAAGRVHGCYGAEGSGKTTIARLLTGALTPDTGDVLCAGRSLDRLAARRLGVVANGQALGLLPGRSVAANIFLGRERRTDGRVDITAMVDDAEAILRTIGAKRVDPRSRLTSLGALDRLLVECARVLATRSTVFVLDEPTRGFEPAEAERAHAALRVLADAGAAILVLSADLAELVEHCDAVSLF